MKTMNRDKLTPSFTEKRGVSPVIGVILMVAITVILAAVIAFFVLGVGSDTGTTPQAAANWDQQSANTDWMGGFKWEDPSDGNDPDYEMNVLRMSLISGDTMQASNVEVRRRASTSSIGVGLHKGVGCDDSNFPRDPNRCLKIIDPIRSGSIYTERPTEIEPGYSTNIWFTASESNLDDWKNKRGVRGVGCHENGDCPKIWFSYGGFSDSSGISGSLVQSGQQYQLFWSGTSEGKGVVLSNYEVS